MSQKTMIALAASLTAFILVIAGGVFARMSSPAAAAPPTATISPAVLELWSQRETAYRDRIDQANRRLSAAEQGATAEVVPASANPAAPVVSLTAADATQLALMAARGARLEAQPELVLFQGVTAYEVRTSYGIVYINANTGAVLYNGTARTLAAAPQHEPEDDEHDDDD